MTITGWSWLLFNIFVLAMLIIDQFVFHRKAHEIKLKEALGWTVLWVALGVLFTGFIYYKYEYLDPPAHHSPVASEVSADTASHEPVTTSPLDATHTSDPPHTSHKTMMPTNGWDASVMYLTGYIIEKSLSMDNLFVFLMIFTYFRVPAAQQHRVLFWGILGALVFRAIFIFAGVVLIHKFHWIIYVFGAFLIITGLKMAFATDKEIHPEKNPVLILLRKIIPITPDYHGSHFFRRIDHRLFATPLFVTLIVVETTDIIFAVDSIPAILSITTDPYIVYTSNVFAILGLRAMYFALAAFMKLFVYLNIGLAIILVFVGIKMTIVDFYKIDPFISLAVVCSLLVGSVIVSLLFPKKEQATDTQEPAQH